MTRSALRSSDASPVHPAVTDQAGGAAPGRARHAHRDWPRS